MIKHLRIDNRLIHGQVVVTWRAHVEAEIIIVCNDKVADDPFQKKMLPLSMRDTPVLVLSIAETIRYAQEHESTVIFVICKFPADALALLESGIIVKEVNVGNAAPQAGTKFARVTRSISVTAEEAATYRKIAEFYGGKLFTQMVPTHDKEDFLALLKKAGL